MKFFKKKKRISLSKDLTEWRGSEKRAVAIERRGNMILLIIPLLFLSMFFYYPLISILNEGLTDEEGRTTLKHIFNILSDSYYVKIILFTIEQALLSTLASIILGLPGAFILARYEFRGKSLIRALTTIPFVLPSIIVVLGFVIFFGNNGILNRAIVSLFNLKDPPLKILYSMKAIILAHAFYNFPIMIRLVSAVWSRINPNLERAGANLGARGLKLFRYITLPQIMPGIMASAALIFIFCFTSFAIILVLSGGPKYSTIEVEIYRLAKVSLNLKGGSALAIVETLLSILFMYIYINLQKKTSFGEKIEIQYERKKLYNIIKTPSGILAVFYLIVVFLLILAPMFSAVAYSFFKRSGWAGNTFLTIDWYKKILSQTSSQAFSVSYITAIKNSLFFGLMTILISLPIGTMISYLATRKTFPMMGVLESFTMLPLGISSIILALGYIKAYQELPINITGKWYAIAFAHTIIAFPFVVRSTSAVFRKISPRVLQAARILGANRWRTFWYVELPLIKSGLITGATFAFAISIGEINATLMLYNPNLTTIPIAIYRLISSYNYFAACALGTILMLVCFLVFLIIDRIGLEVS